MHSHIERFALHFLAVSLGASLLVVLGLFLLLGRIQSPLLVFDVTSEQFSQLVVRPELTAFAVTDADVRGGATCADAGRYSGVVEPPSGSRLTYRWRPDQVAISVDIPEGKSARFIMAGEQECQEQARRITIRTAAIGQTDPAWRLPIAGPAEVGSETLANVPGDDGWRRLDMLRSGSFEVFGRSLNLGGPGALFPISSSPIAIPAGSRIGSLDSADEASATWFGSALHSEEGFLISATAEANSVQLFRPGMVDQQERFEFGVFASIAGDPGLGMLFLVVFIAVTTMQVIASWIGLWPRKKEH